MSVLRRADGRVAWALAALDRDELIVEARRRGRAIGVLKTKVRCSAQRELRLRAELRASRKELRKERAARVRAEKRVRSLLTVPGSKRT